MPNLALMKISAYYKKLGFETEKYSPLQHFKYKSVFVSKIFKYPHPNDAYIRNDMIKGGPGFDTQIKLSKEIDHIYPNYELYNCDYALGYLCYDKKTQILTKKGWKLFKNLSFRDQILTLNPSSHEMEYQEPLEIISNDYEGELISFKNKYVDLLVTPNHRLYIKRRDKNNLFNFVKAESIENLYQFRFKKDGIWKGKEKQYFYLPKIKKDSRCKNIKKIPMDLWLEYLGYYISEGNTLYKKKTHSYLIKIAQSNKSSYYKTIKDCIDKLGLNYYISPSGDFTISNKQIYSYLKELGYSYQKYIPREFLDLSSRQLKILFDAIYVGDGTHYKGKNSKTKGIGTTSYKLASNIQEILLKIGYCGDIRLVRKVGSKTYFKKEKREIIARHNYYMIYCNTHYTNPTHLGKTFGRTERLLYKDKVYCCSVPNEIIYVRRNGKTVWCGNTKGCIRKCPWCIVPNMEGNIHKYADLEEFCKDQENVRLLDNNILAYKNHIQELERLYDSGRRIDFTQGLDIRLITYENASILADIHLWKGYRLKFAFDDPSLKNIIEKKLEILYDVGFLPPGLQFYILIGFNTNFKQDLMRINFLKEKGIAIFIMPYNKVDPYQMNFARWVNRYFYKYLTFQEYLTKKDRIYLLTESKEEAIS